MEAVDEALLERSGVGERDLGQESGVEAQSDRHHRDQHRGAEAAPDPFAGAERALHRGEDPAADEQRQRQRCRGAGGIGKQQKRGLNVRALQRRSGEDEAEYRPGARGPEQAGRDAQQ
jgi:hypothetical protein